MCSHYDGEWCLRERLIKTRRRPCDSCQECRIKINEKLSFCPYKTVLPDWLVWILARIGFAISLVMTLFMMFVTGFFIAAAIASMLDWEIPMALHALAVAMGCMFLTILCKSCVAYLHGKYL
jgi:hypothetical protein